MLIHVLRSADICSTPIPVSIHGHPNVPMNNAKCELVIEVVKNWITFLQASSLASMVLSTYYRLGPYQYLKQLTSISFMLRE